MTGLAWLTARPIAHRGLHDAAAGVIENTASAFSAAIAGGYGIETDLQISADGEAMVHHDDALGRLTEGSGRLSDMAAAVIKRVRFKTSADRILTLGELCDLVGGRAALVLELKSHFDSDRQLAQRAADVLANYAGPVAVLSFDPAMIEVVRSIAPHLTRGIVAERHYAHHEWDRFPRSEKRRMAFLLHANRTRPQFIAYRVKDLPAVAPLIARMIFRLPLLTWTVRSDDDRRCATRWADQMIFEGIRP
ncbi:MAG TPA: glycerophosphodiester phosphodiesterase family protein [Pseudolabrys sp.]|nr:glycerophosphodiester phosphodiesterase family protein [Pseudolabrys sp.]